MPQRRSIFRGPDPEWADERGIGEGPRPAFGYSVRTVSESASPQAEKREKIRQKSEIKRKE